MAVSFRSLLKRYVTTSRHDGTLDGPGIAIINLEIFPASNGTPGVAYNNFRDLFGYLRYSYLAVRGSIRHRLHLVTDINNRGGQHVKISLRPAGDPDAQNWTNYSPAPAVNVLDGTVTYVPAVNGAVEVEFPFFTNNLFLFAFNSQLIAGPVEEMEYKWIRQFLLSYEYGATDSMFTSVAMDTAAGEDFSFMRFQGACFYNVS